MLEEKNEEIISWRQRETANEGEINIILVFVTKSYSFLFLYLIGKDIQRIIGFMNSC